MRRARGTVHGPRIVGVGVAFWMFVWTRRQVRTSLALQAATATEVVFWEDGRALMTMSLHRMQAKERSMMIRKATGLLAAQTLRHAVK
jgi:hypothetical protein